MVHGLAILRGWTIAALVFRGLLVLAVVALIILLIIWAVRAIRHTGRMGMGPGGWHHHDDPLEIAKARYAKGEISQAEYKKLVNDLKE